MTTPDPTRSKAIEVTARAICGPPGNACEACRLSAERALTAYESHLQAEGMAVVPVDLSDEQVRDLRFQSAPYPKHPDADQVWSMGPRHVRAFWQKAIAMLSASPYGKASMQEDEQATRGDDAAIAPTTTDTKGKTK